MLGLDRKIFIEKFSLDGFDFSLLQPNTAPTNFLTLVLQPFFPWSHWKLNHSLPFFFVLRTKIDTDFRVASLILPYKMLAFVFWWLLHPMQEQKDFEMERMLKLVQRIKAILLAKSFELESCEMVDWIMENLIDFCFHEILNADFSCKSQLSFEGSLSFLCHLESKKIFVLLRWRDFSPDFSS